MFDPASVQTFRITQWDFEPATGEVQFHYAFDDAVHFTETFTFPPCATLSAGSREALDRCLRLLHLVVGVSYFKAAAPSHVSIETSAVPDAAVDLLRSLLAEGLGEFAFNNGIALPRPQISYTSSDLSVNAGALLPPSSIDGKRRPLVAVGGGKDSCVSIEMLRHLDPLLASINQPRAIRETIDASGLSSVHAARKLSPQLLALNSEGALNGHVPVTAIVSLTLVALAIITDRTDVVMSNERSASSGNFIYDGVEINHQFSKSLAVEQRLASLVHTHISADVRYFSLLRPFSELEIARRFASTTRYDAVFTSCNRAFRIDESRRIDHWCCDCDKCRFVFLALAPFTSVDRLTAIFGKNMLDDSSQIAGFDALIGWNADKPFECVGEVEESIAALEMLHEQPEWSSACVVQRFWDEVRPQLAIPPDVRERPFAPSAEHCVPDEYREVLRASV